MEDWLDDRMAEKIGEGELSEWDFVEFWDYSALPGVTYRYWVVARNAAGESQKSSSATARLLEPLEITASEVPAGVSEIPYEYALEAQGGGGEYLWYVPALRSEVKSENTYVKVGNPIDESQNYYPLPFDFVIGDQVINEVEVDDACGNGKAEYEGD